MNDVVLISWSQALILEKQSYANLMDEINDGWQDEADYWAWLDEINDGWQDEADYWAWLEADRGDE